MAGRTPTNSTVVLDCTLRDGGYYNDWDFSDALVARYLSAMADAQVPVVELGFRFLEPHGFAGPTAHTTDQYIAGFDIPAHVCLGVMLNAKDVVTYVDGPVAAIDRLFAPSDRSRVDLVRIASTWSEIATLRPAVDRLHDLGYTVGVNLMQVHARSSDELTEFGQWCSDAQVAVSYFADSFGGLYPSDIAPIVEAIRRGFAGPIGCHLHDNLSLAMANSLAALDAGVSWVDSTIRGMGRGPGNARTEYLAVELRRRGLIDLDVQALIDIVSHDFADLQDEYGWGTNLFYVLSATNGVHPTYVQTLMSDPRFDSTDIVATIDQLGRMGGAKFSMDLVSRANAAAVDAPTGTWDATGWCAGRQVLVLGPGKSAIDRRDDIEAYIAAHDPLVVNLNLTPLVDHKLIDVYIACNPMRAEVDIARLPTDGTPVIAPRTVGSLISTWQENRPVHDYGLRVQGNSLDVGATDCTVPHGLVAAYALAVLAQGGAAEIALVGLDGFDSSDPRQAEMLDVFDLFTARAGSPNVIALTPTTYPVVKSSLYAPRGL